MADITVTIPNSTFTIDTISNGIEVTTPTQVVVEVSSDSNTIDVTNTTQAITITEVGITNTDQLIEGTTNLFFTNARARAAISLTTDDSSILDYNSSTGVFTWDTPTTTKILEGTNLYFTTQRARTSISAGTGISYDSSTGVITNTSINTDTTYTQNISSTTGGANLNLVGSDSTTDTVKFASGTGVTVAYTDANTATISIGQSVGTTDAVSFGSVNIDSRAVLDTATLTTSATTADQVLDSFTATTYRTAKYLVSITSGTDYQSVEILVVHNGTTASQTTYADIATNTSLATFNVDISGGAVRLLTTPTNSVTVYKVARTTIVV